MWKFCQKPFRKFFVDNWSLIDGQQGSFFREIIQFLPEFFLLYVLFCHRWGFCSTKYLLDFYWVWKPLILNKLITGLKLKKNLCFIKNYLSLYKKTKAHFSYRTSVLLLSPSWTLRDLYLKYFLFVYLNQDSRSITEKKTKNKTKQQKLHRIRGHILKKKIKKKGYQVSIAK